MTGSRNFSNRYQRPGNIRVLFGFADNVMIIVNIFKKKTQKTPLQEIKLAENRLKEYGI